MMTEAECGTGAHPDLVDRLRALPKAEVHLHLEGCLDARADATPDTPRRLADSLMRLRERASRLTTSSEVAAAAYSCAAREHASGVWYADVIVNPGHWRPWEGRLSRLLDSLEAGFSGAEADGLTPVGLCVSLGRDSTEAEIRAIVDELGTRTHPRIVALSLDGDESLASRASSRTVESAFEQARAMGLRCTVHAGESGGPDGIRYAIEHLGADRIDHGVRGVEDDGLVAELARRRIPLGMAPSSNLRFGLYDDLSRHPADALYRAGVPISINTDSPASMQISLEVEYYRCMTAFSWPYDVLRDLAATSIDACFASSSAKYAMRAALVNWPDDVQMTQRIGALD